jgi:hypothetical protein
MWKRYDKGQAWLHDNYLTRQLKHTDPSSWPEF